MTAEAPPVQKTIRVTSPLTGAEIGVLPLLGLILLLWGNQAIDLLLSGRVRADLAVAQGYFDRVQAEVGSGTQAVASSHQLVRTLALTPPVERETALAALLAREQVRHRLDFLRMLPPRLPRRWWR